MKTRDKKTIIKIRKEILQTTYNKQEGHIPSAFSILDIIWVLYDQILKPKDKFILSKGQGCLALYAVLAEKNILSKKELLHGYCKYNSILGGHPDRNKIPEVTASTGSLGHGLPIAVGIAMSNRIKNNRNRVFCLIGDGEANEGTIWESALLANHYQLSSLYLIIDYNHSTDRALNLGDLGKKFKAFGWNILKINGHNHYEIKKALRCSNNNKPTCIIANTIKGKGLSAIENNPAWHHRAPNKSEYLKFIKEIK